jgi:exodeoxyribonuclease-1
LGELVRYHREYRYPVIPDLDADCALYQNGFPDPYDISLFDAFHAAPLKNKITICDRFRRRDHRELALRVLGRNYPGILSGKHAQTFNSYLLKVNSEHGQQALKDCRNHPRRTPQEAMAEIHALKCAHDPGSAARRLLNELAHYIRNRFTVNNDEEYKDENY